MGRKIICELKILCRLGSVTVWKLSAASSSSFTGKVYYRILENMDSLNSCHGMHFVRNYLGKIWRWDPGRDRYLDTVLLRTSRMAYVDVPR